MTNVHLSHPRQCLLIGIMQPRSEVGDIISCTGIRNCPLPWSHTECVKQGAAASWFGLEAVEEGNAPGQVETEFTRTLSRRLHRRMGSHLSVQADQPSSSSQ